MPFGSFTNEFAITFIEPTCQTMLKSSGATSIERRWGELPETTSFDAYTFSTNCDGDYSISYRVKARQIGNGNPGPFKAELPAEVVFDESTRTFTACKCHEHCASGSPSEDIECNSLPFRKQWEIKLIAELRDDRKIVAKDNSERLTVTLSPDCSSDNLLFTHLDFRQFNYYIGESGAVTRMPAFAQTTPQCPVNCELKELVHMGHFPYTGPY
jgi:hypothetical protein